LETAEKHKYVAHVTVTALDNKLPSSPLSCAPGMTRAQTKVKEIKALFVPQPEKYINNRTIDTRDPTKSTAQDTKIAPSHFRPDPGSSASAALDLSTQLSFQL